MTTRIVMTATGRPLPTGRRGPLTRPRPRPRTIASLLAMMLLLVLLAVPDQIGAVAHATCTLGTPPGTSCGEALVYLGYP